MTWGPPYTAVVATIIGCLVELFSEERGFAKLAVIRSGNRFGYCASSTFLMWKR